MFSPMMLQLFQFVTRFPGQRRAGVPVHLGGEGASGTGIYATYNNSLVLRVKIPGIIAAPDRMLYLYFGPEYVTLAAAHLAD